MTESERKAPEPTTAIREVMHHARQKVGSGTRLAARLSEMGIGPSDGYSESAISNWINGRTMPPADVLLAAAIIGEISLDARIGEAPAAPDGRAWQEIVDDLQDQVDDLHTDMIHLYGTLGIPRPKRERPAPPQRQVDAG